MYSFQYTQYPQQVPAMSLHVRGKIVKNGTYFKDNIDVTTHDDMDMIITKGAPLESLVVDMNAGYKEDEQAKCFTFFSALEKPFRDLQVDIDQIQLTVSFQDKTWCPNTSLTRYFLSIHSSNSLPDFKISENFLSLETDSDYQISYSQVNIHRLNEDYDTNCHEYDLDYKFANYNMRSDCIASCYINKMRQYCEYNDLNAQSHYLLRRERIVHEQFKRMKPCWEKIFDENIKINFECHGQCRFDCRFKNFAFNVARTSKAKNPLMSWIHIRHNGLPDINVRHLPETTFIAFVCSFGGLLGMWLGLSMVSVFEVVSKLFKRANVSNFYMLNFKQTNNISNHKPNINIISNYPIELMDCSR